MKHFGIFDTVEDAQDALNAGRLENDYVALVGGDLDYNTLAPACYIGEWSDNGEGTYTFQILDTGDTVWTNGVNIGSLLGVYFNGGQLDMNVKLDSPLSEPNYWTLTFDFEGSDPSESPNNQFNEGSQNTWTCDEVMTSADSSTAQIHVEWDGTDTFVFYQMAQDAPALSMNTINPECSE